MTKESKTYDVYQEILSPNDYVYKLVQLNPEILQHIGQDDESKLLIKSPLDEKSHIVLCTNDKTWKIRQMNHSNNVLLLNDMTINGFEKDVKHVVASETEHRNKLLGIANLSYEYELTKTKGYVNVTDVPIYDGTDESLKLGRKVVIKEILLDSPISEVEFGREWFKLGGIEIQGQAAIMKRNFVTSAIETLITLLISQRIDCTGGSFNIELNKMSELMLHQNKAYCLLVTQTLLHMFGDKDERSQMFRLKNDEIARWFGIETLRNYGGESMAIKDFLIKWKASFPEFYNVPIDLDFIIGFYYRPFADTISFLDSSALTDDDLTQRVKELFKICKEWKFNEFFPFVQCYIPKGKKPETFITKFAKKKRTGKNTFSVTPR